MSARIVIILAFLLVAGELGCEAEDSASTVPTKTTETLTTEAGQRQPSPAELPEVECPPDLMDCEIAGGSILFVERIDPDGDGDAHFVLLSRDGITAPGISIIDVRSELRPRPLPGPGDLLAGAGPVFEGSFGQRQIQAESIAFERR